jgi:hypothetical protein
MKGMADSGWRIGSDEKQTLQFAYLSAQRVRPKSDTVKHQPASFTIRRPLFTIRYPLSAIRI